MARRRRKRGRHDLPGPERRDRPGSARRDRPGSAIVTAGAPSRSEQRNAAVRATLTPLAPGERPWPITVGALLAALNGLVQLILYLAGVKLRLDGARPAAFSVILFAALMLACAGGMWRMRYWAVLGFQALLAIVVLTFALLLIRASSLAGVAISTGVVLGGGFLFYKMVRVLSRLQMPRYPQS